MERDKHVEHQEDIQQRYFQSSQPKFPQQQHLYPARSKTAVNEAETTSEPTAGTTTKDKEFVFLREKGEKVTTLVLKQFGSILWDDFGEPRLDPQGKKIVVIGSSPNDLVSRVFLTKPDERGNMERA